MTRKILIAFSLLCLVVTLVPSFLVFNGSLSLEQNKYLMFIGTVGWFVTAPFWIRKR